MHRDRPAWTMAGIRRLDDFVATPACVILLVSGLLMVAGGLLPFQTSCVVASIVLYLAVVAVGLILYPSTWFRLDAGGKKTSWLAWSTANPRGPVIFYGSPTASRSRT